MVPEPASRGGGQKQVGSSRQLIVHACSAGYTGHVFESQKPALSIEPIRGELHLGEVRGEVLRGELHLGEVRGEVQGEVKGEVRDEVLRGLRRTLPTR